MSPPTCVHSLAPFTWRLVFSVCRVHVSIDFARKLQVRTVLWYLPRVVYMDVVFARNSQLN